MNKSLDFEICSRTDPRYTEIRDEHYVENHGCIGQQVHFLIRHDAKIVGIISGASAVYATAARDEFFGIDKTNRNQFLPGIVDNVAFRLVDVDPKLCLASQVMRLWRSIIPCYWYQRYGTVVYGFETFVVETETRKGALYLADNWTQAGFTTGKTKMRNGIEYAADQWIDVGPKLVFCRWRDGFSHACAARTPAWVRYCCADISPIEDAQAPKNATMWAKDKDGRRLKREYLKSNG
jgi:Domain of unknown function (DUF4338)